MHLLRLGAWCCLLLLLLGARAQAQTNVSHAAPDPWPPVAPGRAIATTGSELLTALQAGDGDVELAGEGPHGRLLASQQSMHDAGALGGAQGSA